MLTLAVGPQFSALMEVTRVLRPDTTYMLLLLSMAKTERTMLTLLIQRFPKSHQRQKITIILRISINCILEKDTVEHTGPGFLLWRSCRGSQVMSF